MKARSVIIICHHEDGDVISTSGWRWEIEKQRGLAGGHSADSTSLARSSLRALCNHVWQTPIWLRLRSSISRNWRKRKRERKIHCLRKKRLNRRSKQASRNEACAASTHCTFHKHCLLILLLLAVQLCKMQRGWIEFKWLCYPFSHQRIESYWQRRPRLPLPSACVAGRKGKELACWWRRKLGGTTVKSRVKSWSKVFCGL